MSRLKQIIFLGLFGVVAVGFLLFFLDRQRANKYAGNDSIKLPTKVEAVGPALESSVISPDGKKTLTMKAKPQGKETVYTFYAGNELTFTKTTSGKMSIPYNTWSVDNKYVFLKEEVDGKINFYLEPGDINITDKFKEKFPDYTLQDATGWAGDNLIVINADDGKNDISFWFDITSKSFIRLSNRFE